MNANVTIFGEHPSQVLKSAYRGYQGCKPEDAKVIFLGKDPNYHRDIENWSVFNEMVAYLQQGIGFYLNNQNIHPFRHHPFLSPNYRNPNNPRQKDGYRYHTMFRRIFGPFSKGGVFKNTQDAADYRKCSAELSFVELVGTPTFGMIQGTNNAMVAEANSEFNRLLFGEQNQAHLKLIRYLVFESSGKTLFVSKDVYSLMQSLFPEFKQSFPKDSYTIETLYQNQQGTCIKSARHLSASIKKEYFTALKRSIMEAFNI